METGAASAAKCVVRRDGSRAAVDVARIERRLSGLCNGLDEKWVRPDEVAAKVVEGLCDGMATAEVDTFAAETCAHMAQRHPDFATLAARLAVTRLHRETSDSFAETCRALWGNRGDSGKQEPLISSELRGFVDAHADELDQAVDYRRDFAYDYFGLRTLEASYLLRVRGKVVERPQHLLMRVACGLHLGDVAAVLECYDLMSRRLFAHSRPTLLHAGTPMPQLMACYTMSLPAESVDAVFKAIADCAAIGQAAGTVGICASDVPAASQGKGGLAQGLVPALKVFDQAARLVACRDDAPAGAVTAYVEPWHADVLGFLEMCRPSTPEERRALALGSGLMVPDLFMRRVEADADWTLFCPRDARDPDSGARLSDLWGEDFDRLYERLEAAGRGRQTMRARHLWFRILDAQVEAGMPYMVYKDAVNRKSNLQGLGVVRSFGVGSQAAQVATPEEHAACGMASLSLPAFVQAGQDSAAPRFDFALFHRAVKVVTRSLDRAIDCSQYPLESARDSSLRHRPLALSVQGFADALLRLRLPFESAEAKQLNEEIFEALYFAACDASCELAAAHGPYPSYEGSPASQGQLQFDLWGIQPRSGRWDWVALKARIAEHGLRHSQLVAPAPMEGAAALLGGTGALAPLPQHLAVQQALPGECLQLQRQLVADLASRGLWTEDLRLRLLASSGSVQKLPDVPADLKALYKTAWELPQRAVVDMAADRGAFVDQSQALDVAVDAPSVGKLTSLHFHGWKRGLKTGTRLLRTRLPGDDAEALRGATNLASRNPAAQAVSGRR